MNTPRISLVLIIFIISFSSSTSRAAELPEPKLIAVKFHADWCGSCKKMGTVFTDLRNKFDGQPILFMTLDRTNMSTRNQSDLLISALGYDSIFEKYQGTGFILLIEPRSNQVLKKLTSTQSIKEMAKEIAGSVS